MAVPVARFGSEQAAHIAQAVLEEEGIEAVVVGGASSAIYGGLVFRVELHVAQDDRQLAAELLDRARRERSMDVEIIGPGGGGLLSWAVIVIVCGIALAGLINYLRGMP